MFKRKRTGLLTMKPKYIILIRHAESEGNADRTIHGSKPDFALNLTEKGKIQANEAGILLTKIIPESYPSNYHSLFRTIHFYRSPFYRTRQTHEIIAKHFPYSTYTEDPRLREQEHTARIEPFCQDKRDETEKERDEYGHFYYRFEGGESCADVYDRVSDFLNTLFRDFEKPAFPDNCVIISHGMTNRLFLMRFLHYTVEEFEFLRNPENCGMYILEKQHNDKYKLTEEPKKYEKRNCIY